MDDIELQSMCDNALARVTHFINKSADLAHNSIRVHKIIALRRMNARLDRASALWAVHTADIEYELDLFILGYEPLSEAYLDQLEHMFANYSIPEGWKIIVPYPSTR